eukprot:5586778-Amphidinium_carterae.1
MRSCAKRTVFNFCIDHEFDELEHLHSCIASDVEGQSPRRETNLVFVEGLVLSSSVGELDA